ncbi:hypothetical protein RclHR1_14760006 [Rhizophagus clarus]|uniref:Uncharacterized protein n=1 Tax=Rhizophagus clarus TaxID=94130 RepID=A0A2Z6QST0_9GLOM|nr:hypothetical protein RclHR1_14760006 [Rhizophagus clarus]GES75661.1 hypothetical protein RCL2_000308300 [Rhizophagus clarus]
MVVLNGLEWALALYNYGQGENNPAPMSEYSLRYMVKDGRQILDLTDYNIRGPLKLIRFTRLKELDCSSERKLSPLTKEYNDYSRNDITGIDLSECPDLRKLNCSNNVNLTILNISNCFNLTNINVTGCLNLCKVICDNSPYFPTEIIEKAKIPFCSYPGCQEAGYYNGRCGIHRKYYCKEEGCKTQIHISQEYCSSHRMSCKIFDCSFRTSSPYNYCIYHKKELERKKEQLFHDKNQLKEQITVKENILMQLIGSTKSELVSKSIFPAKRKEKEAVYQNYLDKLLTIQKQIVQQLPSQIQLEQQAKKHLSKKLSEKKIQNLCQAQMELTKLEIDLAELEKKLLQIQSSN